MPSGTGPQGPAGPQGSAGPQGPAGAQGAQGAQGASAALSSTTPSELAITSQVGTGTTAARADHIHGIPTSLVQD